MIVNNAGKPAKAPVFNIQSFSLHDGPGIRTTIFLRGCPLSCLWCHNPESQKGVAELFFYREKCMGCGGCVNICPQKAVILSKNKAITDRMLCSGCGQCVSICSQNAREISGASRSVQELMQQALKDRMFFEESGGGVTLSGGEPLLYPGFVQEMAAQCKKEKIHIAVETCGYADPKILHSALENVDLVLYDIKAFDDKLHKKLTGASNKLILENAIYIFSQLKKDMVIRIPVIPGYNDSEENIDQICKFIIEDLDRHIKIHLLPYHSLGQDKEERLDRKIKYKFSIPSDADMERIKTQMTEYGLDVQIGGSM